MTKRLRPDQFPPWYDGQSINEAAFCREFLASHKLLYTENSFFKCDPDACSDICTLHRSIAGTSSAAAKHIAENITKDISHITAFKMKLLITIAVIRAVCASVKTSASPEVTKTSKTSIVTIRARLCISRSIKGGMTKTIIEFLFLWIT